MKTLSLALVLAAASAAATAQAYRWVDEKGKVHYGDRPPSQATASVPGTRSAKPREGGPVEPGMKPDEVEALFGKPDDVRTVTTRMGQAQYWTYRKPPKGQKTSYTIKFEGGAVSEVSTEQRPQTAAAPPAPTAPQPSSAVSGAAIGGGTVVSTGADPAQQAQREAAAHERQCASARDRVRSVESRMRTGGSMQQMESMREERRRADQNLTELGC
jgi:hypothetical protein